MRLGREWRQKVKMFVMSRLGVREGKGKGGEALMF